MKILKKISLVYTLQIVAVILLFGYAFTSPVNTINKVVKGGIMPLQINKLSPVKADYDSIFTINILGMYTGKSRY